MAEQLRDSHREPEEPRSRGPQAQSRHTILFQDTGAQQPRLRQLLAHNHLPNTEQQRAGRWRDLSA